MASKGEVYPLTLTALLNNACHEFPQHKAVIVSGKFEVTYAELQRLVNRCAAKLRNAGIGTGDVVALTFPNSIEVKFHAVFSFGLNRIPPTLLQKLSSYCCFLWLLFRIFPQVLVFLSFISSGSSVHHRCRLCSFLCNPELFWCV
jgi:hypothetical protein